MVGIINVDKNVRKDGDHEYELRINNFIICRFTHDRGEPLHECLLKAAIAAEKKTMPDSRGMVRPFLEPRYDEVYLAGLTAMSKL